MPTTDPDDTTPREGQSHDERVKRANESVSDYLERDARTRVNLAEHFDRDARAREDFAEKVRRSEPAAHAALIDAAGSAMGIRSAVFEQASLTGQLAELIARGDVDPFGVKGAATAALAEQQAAKFAALARPTKLDEAIAAFARDADRSSIASLGSAWVGVAAAGGLAAGAGVLGAGMLPAVGPTPWYQTDLPESPGMRRVRLAREFELQPRPILPWADRAEARIDALLRVAPHLEADGPIVLSLRVRVDNLRRAENELRAARRRPNGKPALVGFNDVQADYEALLKSVRDLEAEEARPKAPPLPVTVAPPSAASIGEDGGDRSAPVAALVPPPTLEHDAMLSPAQLATAFRLGQDAAEKRLERWRRQNKGSNDWIENTEAKPREPRYFYRLRAVRDVLSKVSREASRGRPAKESGAA